MEAKEIISDLCFSALIGIGTIGVVLRFITSWWWLLGILAGFGTVFMHYAEEKRTKNSRECVSNQANT